MLTKISTPFHFINIPIAYLFSLFKYILLHRLSISTLTQKVILNQLKQAKEKLAEKICGVLWMRWCIQYRTSHYHNSQTSLLS